MSNRSTIELNHDVCPGRAQQATYEWGVKMANYMRSGDPANLPPGVKWLDMRHHSAPALLSDPERAVALLRSLGWDVTPPADPTAAIPEPMVGQVWRSPKPKVEDRTIVKLAQHRCYPKDLMCVYFVWPGGAENSLAPWAWKAWARKSGARPVAVDGQ